MSRFRKAAVIALAVLVLASGAAGYRVSAWFHAPTSRAGKEVRFRVIPGRSLRNVSSDLARAGIIRHPRLFTLAARVFNAGGRIQAGEYLLSASMSPRTVLDYLVSGRVAVYKVTVPEGYRLAQIAEILEAAGLVEAEQFKRAASDREVIRKLGLAGETLEGYLFPDTYLFPGNPSPNVVIEAMVKEFFRHYGAAWEERAAELGLTRHQVVTLASMIEMEAQDPAERKMVAAVFHNRLKRRIRLQSDPTVMYGLGDFDGLTKKDLETPTPYNTYIIKGLPPGPIANPGRAALEAALFPAPVDYLYFVSRNDGTHAFSRNLAQHNRAVRKYRKKR